MIRKYSKGVNIAATLIFEEIAKGATFQYIMGMIDLAAKMGAISAEERQGLIEHLRERGY